MYFANELICYGRIMMVDKKDHYELFPSQIRRTLHNPNQVIIRDEVCKNIYCQITILIKTKSCVKLEICNLL